MSWPWRWPLTYFKVKFVAERGTTILWICLLFFLYPSLFRGHSDCPWYEHKEDIGRPTSPPVFFYIKYPPPVFFRLPTPPPIFRIPTSPLYFCLLYHHPRYFFRLPTPPPPYLIVFQPQPPYFCLLAPPYFSFSYTPRILHQPTPPPPYFFVILPPPPYFFVFLPSPVGRGLRLKKQGGGSVEKYVFCRGSYIKWNSPINTRIQYRWMIIIEY